MIARKAARALQLLLAIPLFVLLRAARALLLVRLAPLNSSRLGHFAANTELYLCERDAAINVPRQRYTDLCYLARGPVANAQLARMWSRCVTLWPTWLLDAVWRWNRLVPGGAAHEGGRPTQSDRDVHDLWPHSPPHLRFTADEEARGNAALRAMGISADADVVCVVARDSVYLNARGPAGRSYDYHDYRNSDIQNYRMAAEALADRGCFVLRMGAVVEAPLVSNHPRVIDYATSGLRSDFLDIYLAKRCLFCLTSGTGYDLVPTIFRKPIAYVNFLAAGYLPTYVKDSVAVYKRFWLSAEQRWLSLAEIFSHDVGFALHSSKYAERGIELIENTPQEIADVALETFERIKGTWRADPNDDALQRRFWQIFPRDATDPVKHRPLHGTVRLKFSAHFLRNHPEFLA